MGLLRTRKRLYLACEAQDKDGLFEVFASSMKPLADNDSIAALAFALYSINHPMDFGAFPEKVLAAGSQSSDGNDRQLRIKMRMT